MIALRWAGTIAAGVLIVSTLLAEAVVVQWEVRGPKLIRQAATAPRDNFLGPIVNTVEARLRAASNPAREVFHLTIRPEVATVPLPWQNISLHRSYEAVRERILRQEAVPPVAELMAIGGDAVLRLRHPNGSISRVLISGRDPLILKRDAMVAEVLHLEFRATRELLDRAVEARMGRPIRLYSPSVQLLTPAEEVAYIYVQLTPWPTDLRGPREVSLAIARRLGIVVASVSFRPDSWFADDNYPVPNPYVEWRQPPELADWGRVPQVFCLMDKEQCRCSAR